MSDLDFELVTNAKMLTEAPPLQKETVVFKDWKTQSGKPAGFLVWELSASDYDEFIKAGWTFNPDGTRKQFTQDDQDIRLAAFTVRDQHGNRLWPTVEAAKLQLRPLGRARLDMLVMAANKANSTKVEDSEGNSDGTLSDSSPTI